MNKATPSEKETAALAEEKRGHRQLLRRRFIGAVTVLSVTLLLWEVGGKLPPDLAAREQKSPLSLSSLQVPELPTLQITLEELDWLPGLLAPEEEDSDSATITAVDDSDGSRRSITVVSEIDGITPPIINVVDEIDDITLSWVEETDETPAAAEPATPAPAPTLAPPPPPKPEPKPEPKPTPKPAPPAEEKTAAAETAGTRYVVQVGAFSQPAGAAAVAKDLKAKGFDTRVIPFFLDDKQLQRVQVHDFETREAAAAAREKLIEIGYTQARIFVADALPAKQGAAEEQAAAKAKAEKEAQAKAAAAAKAEADAKATAEKAAREKAEKEAQAKAAAAAKAKAEADAQAAAEKAAREKAAQEAQAKAQAEAQAAAYDIEVGVFRGHDRVNAAIAALKKAGHPPQVQPVDKDGTRKFRVYATGIAPRASALQLLQTLQAAGFTESKLDAQQ